MNRHCSSEVSGAQRSSGPNYPGEFVSYISFSGQMLFLHNLTVKIKSRPDLRNCLLLSAITGSHQARTLEIWSNSSAEFPPAIYFPLHSSPALQGSQADLHMQSSAALSRAASLSQGCVLQQSLRKAFWCWCLSHLHRDCCDVAACEVHAILIPSLDELHTWDLFHHGVPSIKNQWNIKREQINTF